MQKIVFTVLDGIVVKLADVTYFDNATIEPPNYPKAPILKTLEYLAGGFKQKVEALLLDSKETMQKLVMHLNCQIHNSSRKAEKRRNLELFDFFLDILHQKIESSLSLIRDYVYSFVRLLKSEQVESALKNRCIEILQKFCLYLIENSPSKLEKHLPLVFSPSFFFNKTHFSLKFRFPRLSPLSFAFIPTANQRWKSSLLQVI